MSVARGRKGDGKSMAIVIAIFLAVIVVAAILLVGWPTIAQALGLSSQTSTAWENRMPFEVQSKCVQHQQTAAASDYYCSDEEQNIWNCKTGKQVTSAATVTGIQCAQDLNTLTVAAGLITCTPACVSPQVCDTTTGTCVAPALTLTATELYFDGTNCQLQFTVMKSTTAVSGAEIYIGPGFTSKLGATTDSSGTLTVAQATGAVRTYKAKDPTTSTFSSEVSVDITTCGCQSNSECTDTTKPFCCTSTAISGCAGKQGACIAQAACSGTPTVDWDTTGCSALSSGYQGGRGKLTGGVSGCDGLTIKFGENSCSNIRDYIGCTISGGTCTAPLPNCIAFPDTSSRCGCINTDADADYEVTACTSASGLVMQAGTVGNNPPDVDAGPDQTISLTGTSTSVTLSGTATDPDGIVSTKWFKLDGSTNVFVATGLTTTVTLTAGTYTYYFWAEDSKGGTNFDSVTINVMAAGNHPPVADAGPDLTVTVGQSFQLKAIGSDPDGDPLKYIWYDAQGESVPCYYSSDTSSRFCSLPSEATQSATFSIAGLHWVRLLVLDTRSGSATDELIVNVKPSTPIPYYYIYVPVEPSETWANDAEFEGKAAAYHDFFKDTSPLKSVYAADPNQVQAKFVPLSFARDPSKCTFDNTKLGSDKGMGYINDIKACAGMWASENGLADYERAIGVAKGHPANAYTSRFNKAVFVVTKYSGEEVITVAAHELGHTYLLCDEYCRPVWDDSNEGYPCPNPRALDAACYTQTGPSDDPCYIGGGNVEVCYGETPIKRTYTGTYAGKDTSGCATGPTYYSVMGIMNPQRCGYGVTSYDVIEPYLK